jgi:thiosulfate dehydrogenase
MTRFVPSTNLLSSLILSSLAGALALSAVATVRPVAAQEANIWDLARGGQLYDQWWAALDVEPPNETHPAYPPDSKKKGPETWRCKECHGWDYKGKDGAYAVGSHFTGIKGVRDTVGMDPEKIVDIILDETHGYTTSMLPMGSIRKLALFLSLGQTDMDQYIERATRKARGNVRRGAAFFHTICAVCHGSDGKAMNFKVVGRPEYLGTVANENPWGTFHKIRNAQPGVGMVSLRVLSTQEQADVLAYVQTLPTQ